MKEIYEGGVVMQIIQDRRALHQIPELELSLPKTMAYVKNILSGLNCQVVNPVDSALCAFFDFGADSAIAFRADMDALPVQEKSDKPYISTHPGCMHACGHDGHTAMVLELARRLSAKKRLSRNVLLIFQPGEETPGGAVRLCKTGVLEQYKVEAVFGLHLWPGLEKGKVFSREQELMAQAIETTVDIYGKSSHIAKAHLGIDAMAAAVEYHRLIARYEASWPEGSYQLMKFGKMTSGTVRNVVSNHSHLEGSIRSFRDEVVDGLKAQARQAARQVEEAFGCTVTVHFADGYPAVMNPPQLYRKVRQLVEFEELEEPTMTAEDFSWYQRYASGVFFFLGLGDVPALHSNNFDFDESVLEKGADFLEELAEKYQ